MRNRRRGRLKLAAMDQINVTPLLDLTFVLLIAFMITMPPLVEAQFHGTKIPEMNSDELPKENDDTVVKEVVLARTDDKTRILFDNREMSEKEFIAELEKLKQQRDSSKAKIELLLRADGGNSYKAVIDLMATIRRYGFKEVTLVTQAEREGK